MNPGKVVDPYRIDENLRLGTDYDPRTRSRRTSSTPTTTAASPRATLRCVGVGKCRRDDGGTMCPSYMVDARGEALHARPGAPALRDAQRRPAERRLARRAGQEALDLCLACKGCKGDCPVNVDMATYKAEFLSHYYAGPARARASAYAMGLIYWWARLAALRRGWPTSLTQHAGARRRWPRRSAASRPSGRSPPSRRETFKALVPAPRGRRATPGSRR